MHGRPNEPPNTAEWESFARVMGLRGNPAYEVKNVRTGAGCRRAIVPTTADASTCGISANGYDHIISTTVCERGALCVQPTMQPEMAPMETHQPDTGSANMHKHGSGMEMGDKQ